MVPSRREAEPASGFVFGTCKIRNFCVRAPISTFFICTRRCEKALQLSFRLLGDERKEPAMDVMNSYKAAQDIATTNMVPTHPLRLGLALNFPVFYYEILNSPDKACNMAKQESEEAIALS
uniref:14-3-3 domain-containing protein n=1 Tax=Lactuca sativa TaxID=4236 RepID=A0A9R1UG97_LACSA|nr:hypothetical protein LSAT_V11C900455190 [Lactuca sativa]